MQTDKENSMVADLESFGTENQLFNVKKIK